jgi:hypothetical protein
MTQHLAIKADGSCSRRPVYTCEEIKIKRLGAEVWGKFQKNSEKEAMLIEPLMHHDCFGCIFSPCSAAILKTARRRS